MEVFAIEYGNEAARALWDTTITFDDQYKSGENFSKLVFNLLQAV